MLVYTGFGEKFGTSEYFQNYPELIEPFAERLIDLHVKMVGLDAPSPDRPPFRIHTLLLQNGILIIENLVNLESLRSCEAFEVIVLPIKVEADGAPVRVVAKVP